MDQTQFHRFTQTLQTTLAADERVLALVAISSLAQAERLNQWSDHDFWVVTTTDAQPHFLRDLSWLPDPTVIALALHPAEQYYTVLYTSGHIAEFAIFGPQDLSRGRLTDYRVLFDRRDITHVAARQLLDLAEDLFANSALDHAGLSRKDGAGPDVVVTT